MNAANKLTMLRIFMIPLFLVFLLIDIVPGGRYIAIGIFVVAALTDALDGYIARSKNLITKFGKFLDPVADKLLVCAALVALVELSILPSWVVILIISRDFILMTFRMVASSENVVIAADNIGKIKTLLQMVMIVYLLFSFTQPPLILLGNVLIGLVVFLTILSAGGYILKNRSVLIPDRS